MKLNTAPSPVHTHEGGIAKRINPTQALRRSVLACMLWESEFYESGENIAERISQLVSAVPAENVAEIAIEARVKAKLRHVPLLLVREMARLSTHRHVVAETLAKIIQRPDELAEFVAIYFKDKRQPLSAQVKKGLARAFQKFDEYSLAKYNRAGAIKLRDVLFLCHAKPVNDEQAAIWRKLVDNTLSTPDTWEVALSSGTDKLQAWTRLLVENKLGALALLRNLRNMEAVSVPQELIREALKSVKTERVLPFRFIAAARYASWLEPELEEAMIKCVADKANLSGTTLLMVDVSGSMDASISAKSDLRRIDAACGLAILLREVCENVQIVTFSNNTVRVPARRGFALRDAITQSQPHSGTYLGKAVAYVMNAIPHDRLIVISDEQSADSVPDSKQTAFMVNVASSKNGIGYGSWTHIDGWSESIIDYILALNGDKTSNQTPNPDEEN